MSEMIERVARALAFASLDAETQRAVDLDAHMLHVRGHYEDLARAAIEAMREPTPEMRKAGQFRYRDIDLGNGTTVQGMALGDDPISSYTKMIYAALQEQNDEHTQS